MRNGLGTARRPPGGPTGWRVVFHGRADRGRITSDPTPMNESTADVESTEVSYTSPAGELPDHQRYLRPLLGRDRSVTSSTDFPNPSSVDASDGHSQGLCLRSTVSTVRTEPVTAAEYVVRIGGDRCSSIVNNAP